MKPIFSIIALALTASFGLPAQAQSTTGGRSGGSTASTGTGYLTEGKRAAAGSPASMTIADEGASHPYMYVPPTGSPNRAASPDGSGNATTKQPKTTETAKKRLPVSAPKQKQ